MSKLDKEEQELLASFERDEWQAVGDANRLEELKGYVGATLARNEEITLKLSSKDLNIIQTLAIEEGIPVQILLSSILHKYANGKLIEKA